MQGYIIQNGLGQYLSRNYQWVNHESPEEAFVHEIEDLAGADEQWTSSEGITMTLAESHEGDTHSIVTGPGVDLSNLVTLLKVQFAAAEEAK